MKKRALAVLALCVWLLGVAGCIAVPGEAEECPWPVAAASGGEPATEPAAECA